MGYRRDHDLAGDVVGLGLFEIVNNPVLLLYSKQSRSSLKNSPGFMRSRPGGGGRLLPPGGGP